MFALIAGLLAASALMTSPVPAGGVERTGQKRVDVIRPDRLDEDLIGEERRLHTC